MQVGEGLPYLENAFIFKIAEQLYLDGYLVLIKPDPSDDMYTPLEMQSFHKCIFTLSRQIDDKGRRMGCVELCKSVKQRAIEEIIPTQSNETKMWKRKNEVSVDHVASQYYRGRTIYCTSCGKRNECDSAQVNDMKLVGNSPLNFADSTKIKCM